MESWIGNVVGKMHVNKITQIELAKKMGVTADYVGMILRGIKSPKNAEERINKAIDELIEQKRIEL